MSFILPTTSATNILLQGIKDLVREMLTELKVQTEIQAAGLNYKDDVERIRNDTAFNDNVQTDATYKVTQ